MKEYALTTLNMIDYVGIYLKKQSVEYVRIVLKVWDAVHSSRIVQSTEQLPKQRRIQNTVKHLRWLVLQKK